MYLNEMSYGFQTQYHSFNLIPRYVRSKYLKRKNRPRHVIFTANLNDAEKKDEELSDQSSEEAKNKFVPKQPIPKDGWFPEYDSSSSSDFENLENLSSIFPNTVESKSDKNWFAKELDNVKLYSESADNEKNYEKHSKAAHLTKKSEDETFDLSLKTKITTEQKNGTACFINNDEELEFLLSLKEPVYTGPVIVKQNIEDDRRFVLSNNTSNEQKPIKSIDLEKWLDSVLDD